MHARSKTGGLTANHRRRGGRRVRAISLAVGVICGEHGAVSVEVPSCDDVVVKVQRVSDALVEPMAALLVDRHRDHSPLGATSVLADHATAVKVVTTVLDSGSGYAATEGSELLGFMVAPFPTMPGPTSARLGMAHHAARAELARSVYRNLYQAAAADLVASGITYHSLPVLADRSTVVEAFIELEFGIDQIDGILAVPRDASAERGSTRVRRATTADVTSVVDLAIELQRFHSRPPMFQAAIGLDVAQVRRGVELGLDDDRSIVVVVEGDDGLLGMAQAGPANAYADTVDIGMNVITEGGRSQGLGTAMLHYLLGWAASRRYRYCTVGWTSSNLMSDAFYRSRGFAPVRFRLHRRIDPRISWANETLDDRHFSHRRRHGD